MNRSKFIKNEVNCNLNEEVLEEINKVHKIFTYPCP